eukprot:COSAG06_NODE_1200_length_10292_cov_59.321201_15_plen_96_part_01
MVDKGWEIAARVETELSVMSVCVWGGGGGGGGERKKKRGNHTLLHLTKEEKENHFNAGGGVGWPSRPFLPVLRAKTLGGARSLPRGGGRGAGAVGG